MTLSFKAVYFDMDGTLVHGPEQNLHYEAWKAVLKYQGIDDFQLKDFIDLFFGRANEQIFKALNEKYKVDAKRASHDKEKYYCEELLPKHLFLVDGVETFLTELQKQKVQIGIITSAPYQNLKATWDKFRFERFFKMEMCVMEEDVMEQGFYKPHPEPFEKLMRKTGIPKHETIFIGDSHADIIGAKNVGIYGVGIATHHTPEELYQLGARVVYRDYTQIDIHELSKKNFEFVSAKAL